MESPFYDASPDDIPDGLTTWELDPTFRAYSRAVPAFIEAEEYNLATVRNNASQLLKQHVVEHPAVTCAKTLSPPGPGPAAKGCPLRPYHLMRTHVKLTLTDGWTIEQLVEAVSALLHGMTSYDFCCDQASMMWKGKYLQGCQSCVIHLHLYCDLEVPNAYFLEACRVSGDSQPFHDFYRSFRTALQAVHPLDCKAAQHVKPLKTMPCQLPCGLCPEAFLKSIQPILKMSGSAYYEVKLEAARMLTDLSLHEASLLTAPSNCSAILQSIESLLIHDSFAAVREAAVMALGALVEVPGYGSTLAKSDVLSILLGLVMNPSSEEEAYESAQVRRECGRIMAVIAAADAPSTLSTLSEQRFPLGQWMESIPLLTDARLRSVAERIEVELSAAL